jgi:predicted ferric reductase
VTVVHALWLASRATGLVALALLTASLVLGVLSAGRTVGDRWPRFALGALHRNLSVLSVVFLGVHIASAVIDPYAGIGWLDTVVPFVSVYQPFWLGLGATASDLLLAVLISSVLRTRITLRAWRAVHWAGYACWPVALVHGLGIGGRDSGLTWVLSLNVTCVLVVLVALACRLRGGTHPDDAARRAATVGGR